MDGNSRVIWLDEKDRHTSDLEELDGGENSAKELTSHIPEELIEGILSRVSYPSLYKARLLCRSWYSKFFIPPRDHHGLVPTTPFQSGVQVAAVKWPTYGPVSVFGRKMLGYDRSSNCWHKLAMHERVPVDMYAEAFSKWRIAFAGCLMCAVGRAADGSLQLLVTNTLTGEWSLLPCPPENRGHPILDFRFLSVDSQNYKIIVHNLPCPEFQAHVFESNRGCRTWTSLSNSATTDPGVPGLSPFSAYTDAYINGAFYCMSCDSMGGKIIWKFTNDTGIWEHVVNSPSPAASKLSCLAARVHQLNLQLLEMTQISKSPPELVMGMQTATIVADAECIYFCDIPDQGPASFTSFNVTDLSWRCIPSPSPEYKWKWGRFSTYEPGFNPFASP